MVILKKNVNLKANLNKYTTGLNTTRDAYFKRKEECNQEEFKLVNSPIYV